MLVGQILPHDQTAAPFMLAQAGQGDQTGIQMADPEL